MEGDPGEPDPDNDGEEDGEGGASIEEIEFDFQKSLYDFCHQAAE